MTFHHLSIVISHSQDLSSFCPLTDFIQDFLRNMEYVQIVEMMLNRLDVSEITYMTDKFLNGLNIVSCTF